MRVELILIAVAALAAEPVEAIFQRAVAALSAGDYASAEQGFRSVLKSEPNNIGALGNLGVVYSRANRLSDAAETYRRALRLAPSDKGLLLNLGLVEFRR